VPLIVAHRHPGRLSFSSSYFDSNCATRFAREGKQLRRSVESRGGSAPTGATYPCFRQRCSFCPVPGCLLYYFAIGEVNCFRPYSLA